MALRPILTFEHPVLREKAKKVARVDTSIQRLIDDLTETMLDAPGAGLAANQIGVPLRVCVVKGDDNQIWGLVNPEIVKHDGVLFIDRLTNLDTLRRVEELQAEDREAAVAAASG